MTFIVAWIAYPVLVLSLALGIGLLVRRVAGPRALPGMLLVPLGFAGIAAISVFPAQLDALAELSGPVILTISVIGLVLARRELVRVLRPTRAWAWPAAAAALPGGAIAAPIVLTGQPGVTGYTRNVDLAHQLEFTAWITSMGRVVPPESAINSSYLETVFKMTNVGYPGGSQTALGATSSLVATDPLWTYQPFLALVAAMLGLALYALLGRAIPSPGWRALAAGVAAQPTILYSYGLVAGIKELSAIAAITLTTAVLVAHRPSQGGIRQLLPAAVALAAALAVFNLGSIPWIAMLVVVVLAADLARSQGGRLRAVGRWATLGALTIVLALPTILVAPRLASVAVSGGPPDLGNLAAPVPGWAAIGPWLTDDHRFPLAAAGDAGMTYVLIAMVLALGALGLLRGLRARDLRLLALSVAGAVGLAFVTSRAGPWVDLKAYAISAPISVALAFAGAAALATWRRIRWLAPVGSLAVAGAVLYGNALVYHDMTVTPYERFADLQRLAGKYAGQGPTVLPDFEEFGEYLLREERAVGIANPPRGRFVLAVGARPGLRFARDPDELNTKWLSEHRLLIVRRDPMDSRPPSDWVLIERGRFYDVWRRRVDAPRVVAHLPLHGRRHERGRSFCQRVERALSDAGPGARLAYAIAPEVVQPPAGDTAAPPAWLSHDGDFIARGPGRVEAVFTLPQGGEHGVWMRASVGRQVRVLVDGRPLGAIRWQENYPGQYESIGSVRLRRGKHRLSIERSGGSLLPGTGDGTDGAGVTRRIGPVAFVPVDRQASRIVSAAGAGDACRSDLRLDWVEILKPR